jgi:drug/metabolite transporter (DMT)-like permease
MRIGEPSDPEPVLSSPAANRRGILAMLAAMSLFTANDTLLKLATESHPPGQIMAVRGVFAVLLSLGVIVAAGQLVHVRSVLSPLVLLRASLEAGVAFLFITSLAVLPLANITAILQATPIIMAFMAVLLGIETVGWRRWSAIVVGFMGVLLIVRPGLAGFDAYAVLALLSAVLVACRDFATRAVGVHVPSIVITLSTTAGVCLAGFLLGAAEDWRPLAVADLGLLATAATFVTAGNFAVITAFRGTDVSAVSPFRYSNVPLAIVLGVAVFGDVPDLFAATGIALIVASGIYTIHRERVRQREAATRSRLLDAAETMP